MYWLNMSLQIPILGSLIITLIARISDFFMYRLNMNLQISLCRSLMVTFITRIFDLTLLASVQAGEHLLGQGCPVLFITLSSLILAGKWGGSRVQWGGWSFFRPRCPHQSGATSQHSLSEYLHSESFLTTEKPALSCPDNLSLTQEVTGHTHTYSCLVGLLPPLHQVAKYWELWHQISKIFTLLPTKSVTGLLMSWLMILLSKYYTEETKPFNLYLLKKRISGSLWFICLCLVWSYQQVRTGQNCLDIFHYKWLYYWRKVRFAVSKSI